MAPYAQVCLAATYHSFHSVYQLIHPDAAFHVGAPGGPQRHRLFCVLGLIFALYSQKTEKLNF